MKQRDWSHLLLFVWVFILPWLLFGCSGAHTSHQSGNPVSDTTVARNAAMPKVVGIAPFRVSLSLPDDIKVPEDGGYCQWETGDGHRHIGTALEYEYTVPGIYHPSWTIYRGKTVVKTAQQETVEVLGLSDARCESRNSLQDLTEFGHEVSRKLDETSLAKAITLSVHSGFVLVSPPNFNTIGFIRGRGSTAFAESRDFIFTYYSDNLFALSKATGKVAFQVDFSDLTSSRVSVEALAYSSAQKALFVLVYPITEEEVKGTCYTITPGTWTIERLPTASPIRPYTAGFQMIVNDETNQLILTTSGPMAPSRLMILSGTTGDLLYQSSFPCSGYRGMQIDVKRHALWLADNDTVYRISLGVDGLPIGGSKIKLACETIAIDQNTGLCYCIRATNNTQPLEIVVLDGELQLALTASVDNLQAGLVSSLTRCGAKVVDRPQGGTLLIAGDKIDAISLQTFNLKSSCPIKVDTWVVGEAKDGTTIFIDPWSLTLFSLKKDKLSPFGTTPEKLLRYRGKLLDAIWVSLKGAIILLFPESLVMWDPTNGNISVISLEKYVTDNYRSTLERVRILSLSADGSIFLHLPGRYSSQNPVYYANWKSRTVAKVLDNAPFDRTINYYDKFKSFVWLQDGAVVLNKKRQEIILPQNVCWDEKAGLAIDQSTGIAVAVSAQPSGIIGIVDLEQGKLNQLIFVGPWRGRPLQQLKGGNLWITDSDKVQWLSISEQPGDSSKCYSIPYSLQGYPLYSPDPKHVNIACNGSMYLLTQSYNGAIYVASLSDLRL